jgi:hypothetical protein
MFGHSNFLTRMVAGMCEHPLAFDASLLGGFACATGATLLGVPEAAPYAASLCAGAINRAGSVAEDGGRPDQEIDAALNPKAIAFDLATGAAVHLGSNLLPVGGDSASISAATAGDASSAAQGARLESQLAAEEIAGGHAFEKHVIDLGEFPGVRTRPQYADMIENVIRDYDDIKHLSAGRTAYWRDGVVVIRNPSAIDGGTAFVPRDGFAYFERL